jgi:hypothetical protein
MESIMGCCGAAAARSAADKALYTDVTGVEACTRDMYVALVAAYGQLT